MRILGRGKGAAPVVPQQRAAGGSEPAGLPGVPGGAEVGQHPSVPLTGTYPPASEHGSGRLRVVSVSLRDRRPLLALLLAVAVLGGGGAAYMMSTSGSSDGDTVLVVPVHGAGRAGTHGSPSGSATSPTPSATVEPSGTRDPFRAVEPGSTGSPGVPRASTGSTSDPAGSTSDPAGSSSDPTGEVVPTGVSTTVRQPPVTTTVTWTQTQASTVTATSVVTRTSTVTDTSVVTSTVTVTAGP